MVLFTMCAFVFANAQQTVSGKVYSADGQVLGGATISVKGIKLNTITKEDGTYSINIPKGASTLLVATFIGYLPSQIDAKGKSSINMVLQKEDNQLNEVVVVGYGTQKKRDVTGSVVSVGKDRLQSLPNTNILQAIQGSVPGVQINMNGGGAESNDQSILIRGRNSISASTSPLIIWDGIPYEGGVSELNPNDVESIEILKDASATAIYGARGSNGVILVTSKQGKKGKMVITYDGSYGTQEITNKPNLLNGADFYKFKTTRLNSSNLISAGEQNAYDFKNWIDWYDLSTQQGIRSQHSITVAGASDKVNYYFGGTFLDVTGVALNDKFKRYSIRPNLEVKVTNWLTVATSTQISVQVRDGLPVEFDDTRNAGGGANFFNPLTTPYVYNTLSDGTVSTVPTIAMYAYPDYTQSRNPLSNLLVKNADKSYRIFSANNLKIDFPFLVGLSYKLNTGFEYENTTKKTYWGREVATGYEGNGVAETYNALNRSFTVENIINYSKEFGKNSINITGLYSSQSKDFDRDQLTGQGFPNDVLTNYQMASAALLTPSSANNKQNLISQMARINYGYDGKYLLTLTARRDGFSGFGVDNKYGIFPSAALAWNLHKEGFMKSVSFINNLKLRVSYGLNGNQAISPYSSLAKLSNNYPYLNGTTMLPGYVPNSLSNGKLGWESTKSTTVGADFAILKSRIQGTVDFYKSNTEDLLLYRVISSVHGFNKVLQNIGKTANKGFEIGLTTTNIRTKEFTWTSNMNLSHNENKIVDLYGDGTDDKANAWFIGKPINVIYGLESAGVFKYAEEIPASVQKTSQLGWVKVNNYNGDTLIDANDRHIIGQTDPKFIWGLTNTFKYKGLSVMVFIHGVNGVTKRDPFEDDNVFTDTKRNTTYKDWWSPTNIKGTHFSNDAKANPYGVNFYESGDFIRIKDISIGYDFQADELKKLRLTACKIYVTGRNMFTFTKYKALDPEFNNQYSLPLQKELVFGLSITL